LISILILLFEVIILFSLVLLFLNRKIINNKVKIVNNIIKNIVFLFILDNMYNTFKYEYNTNELKKN